MNWNALPEGIADALTRTPAPRHVEEFTFTLVDTLASAWSAEPLPPSPLRPAAQEKDAATSWTTGERIAPSAACYDNAHATHASEFDCIHYMAVGHPGAVLLPALLALMESGLVTARQVIGGYLAGLETMATLGEAVGDRLRKRGFHATPVLGAPATAAAVAGSLGVGPSALGTAMFLALTSQSGYACAHGTVGKAHQVAAASRAGLEAGLRATAFGDGELVDVWHLPLEALLQEQLPAPVHRFADPWALDVLPTHYKKYPLCGYFDAPLDHLAALRDAGFLRDARTVTLGVPEYVAAASKYARPRTVDEARFSLPYAVAGLLTRGTVDPRLFTRTAVADPELTRRAADVVVEEVPGELGPLGDTLPGFVRVRRSDGREETTTVVYEVVPPTTDWARARAKLHDALPRADGTTADGVIAQLRGFEQLDGPGLGRLLTWGADNR